MPGAPLSIGIVAGEASGDTLGAHLIGALRARRPHLRFAGVGGPKMQAAGMEILFPLEKLAVRGYVEVLRHYAEIVGIRRKLAAHFRREPPALFIGVDAPDFNLDLERKLKSAGIPSVHYVSPQLWAWRGGRIGKIRRAVSKMLVVFPFEEALYEQAGVPVSYVGHPLADMLAQLPGRAEIREQLRLSGAAKIIALLPGSRVTEVEQMANLFVDTAVQIAAAAPDVLFLVPMVNRATRAAFESALYRRRTGELNLTILFGHAHEAMVAADVVLAASGTATLEAALLARPLVITYRMPRLSWWIMKSKHYQPYVGLPNILAGEFVAPEFLQDDATPENLSQAVLNLMYDMGVRHRVEARFSTMARELRQNSAKRLVDALLPMVDGAGAR
ncbi:MAG: lipid-A-disaccharide synthase [Betaproteobacteria bacterium]|nr:lipid-A-disaccharide synthase [Betaproteobacteria bacterium]